MPVLQSLLSTPSEQDEQQSLEPPDHNESLENPAHASYVDEYIWTSGVNDRLYQVASMLAEERSNGYSITPPIWPEDPTEDTRDWGVWAFHGLLIYDYYED